MYDAVMEGMVYFFSLAMIVSAILFMLTGNRNTNEEGDEENDQEDYTHAKK